VSVLVSGVIENGIQAWRYAWRRGCVHEVEGERETERERERVCVFVCERGRTSDVFIRCIERKGEKREREREEREIE